MAGAERRAMRVGGGGLRSCWGRHDGVRACGHHKALGFPSEWGGELLQGFEQRSGLIQQYVVYIYIYCIVCLAPKVRFSPNLFLKSVFLNYVHILWNKYIAYIIKHILSIRNITH